MTVVHYAGGSLRDYVFTRGRQHLMLLTSAAVAKEVERMFIKLGYTIVRSDTDPHGTPLSTPSKSDPDL